MNDQQPTGEAQNSQKKEWYKNWWGVIIAIVFLPIFLIWLIWAKTKWNKVVKVVATIVISVIAISVMGNGNEKEGENKSQEATKPAEQVSTPETKAVSEPQSNNQGTVVEEVKKEEPVEPFEIAVTSQIVKKVDGKHRYFFIIKNDDKKDFNGKISITLYNDKQVSSLGGDTFTTTYPIKPDGGQSVYVDINTGPVSVHGEYGITKFKFEVKIDDKVVKSGEGKISNKYEDLSKY